MDLERYLGLPSASDAQGNGQAGDTAGEERRGEPLVRRLMQRVSLTGTLVFAVVWFAVTKLRVLDALSSGGTLALAIALVVAAIVVTVLERRRASAGSDASRNAGRAALEAGDVEAAIAACKTRLAAGPSPTERADVEATLALCAAREQRLDEALLLAEMAEASLPARVLLGRGRHGEVAARVASTLAQVREQRDADVNGSPRETAASASR